MAHLWYVIQTQSNFENKVKSSLLERIVRENLDSFFGEILIPIEEVVEMKMGQQRKSERKFFPGYVLIQMQLTNETWHLVKNTPKVLGFIGGVSDRPAPISDKEATVILQRVEAAINKPRPKVLFEAGQIIRIVDGPFKDFNGEVEEVIYEKSKLRIAVLIFGRSTSVELNFDQVEKT
ncbi:MAG: transcription termination/antitermination protein NusG [Methylococcaceae bacterium]